MANARNSTPQTLTVFQEANSVTINKRQPHAVRVPPILSDASLRMLPRQFPTYTHNRNDIEINTTLAIILQHKNDLRMPRFFRYTNITPTTAVTTSRVTTTATAVAAVFLPSSLSRHRAPDALFSSEPI